MYGAALHSSLSLIAVGGATGTDDTGHHIYLFDSASGRLIRTVDARAGDVRALRWSADGSLLLAVYTGQNGFRAFDVDGRLVFEQSLPAPSYGIAVSADGMAAVARLDGQVDLYRAAGNAVHSQGRIRTSVSEVASVAFSPDGARVVVGYMRPGANPQVYDVSSGRLLLDLTGESGGRVGYDTGALHTVKWSRDGQTIFATGSAYNKLGSILIYRFDARSGRALDARIIASDTVQDLVALDDGRVLYGSHDASWGTVAAGQDSEVLGRRQADYVRSANSLEMSADGRRLRWFAGSDRVALEFDFAQRVVGTTGGARLRAASVRRGLFDLSSRWENSPNPMVLGHSIALQRPELARALALMPGGDGAVLGTSRAVYRVARDGAVAWRQPVDVEVRALNVTDDARLVVGALADGTFRWWRTRDGAHLLSLFATSDGMWVAWTPNGFYDASAGADRLVGWSVDRGSDAASDFFPLNRFRDRFNRPDIIDKVLETADVERAVAAAEKSAVAAREPVPEPLPVSAVVQPEAVASSPVIAAPAAAVAPAAAPEVGAAAAALTTPPAPKAIVAAELPPTLAALESTLIRIDNAEVTLPFTVRSEGEAALIIELRVNGRPAEFDSIEMPDRMDGQSRGVARLAVDEAQALVQLLARSPHGVSEPLSFHIERVRPVGVTAAAEAKMPAEAVMSEAATGTESESKTSAASLPVAIVSAPGADATQVLRPDAPSKHDGRPSLYVLAIGISEYQQSEYRLGLSSKDARDFANAMQGQQGRLYGDVVVHTLTDREATRAAILESLQWLSTKPGPDDVAVLFLAGHGFNEPGGQYYFLPYNGEHDRLRSTGVPESAIRETLGRVKGRAMFFVDTCFAGNVVGNYRTAGRELSRLANDLAAAENGVIVFASSTGRQESEEKDEWGNGAFTKALIEGLNGKADLTRTGRITYKGLDFFVSEEVRRLTEGRQTPVTISPIGIPDFPVARSTI